MVSGYTLKWRHDLPNVIGTIRHIFQYPVKSMAGVCLDTASLGWHGLEGDRRFAFRRAADKSGFPWLTASRLPELLLYKPLRQAELESKHPTHVLTPGGRELEVRSEELQAELAQKHGSAVELMQLNHGIFDEAPVSIISLETILEMGREAGRELDVRYDQWSFSDDDLEPDDSPLLARATRRVGNDQLYLGTEARRCGSGNRCHSF